MKVVRVIFWTIILTMDILFFLIAILALLGYDVWLHMLFNWLYTGFTS